MSLEERIRDVMDWLTTKGVVGGERKLEIAERIVEAEARVCELEELIVAWAGEPCDHYEAEGRLLAIANKCGAKEPTP